jgi:hypothetical protein
MIVLGLVLVLVAVAAGVAVTVDEPSVTTTVTVFNRTYELTSTEMFAAGVVAAALFLLGFALILSGGRRSAGRRQRLRASRLEARDRVARLEDEKRELERQLENTPDAPAPPPAPVATTDTTDTADDRLVAGGRHTRAVDEPVDAPAERG